MASRKIIWSQRAKIKRYEILKYYIKRNKSKAYSIKLNNQFKKGLRLLSKYPNMGIKTDIKEVRGLIIDHYIIFYEIEEHTIIVHYLWDVRQDPLELNIKHS